MLVDAVRKSRVQLGDLKDSVREEVAAQLQRKDD